MPTRFKFKLQSHSETKVGPIERFISADVFGEGNRIGGSVLTATGWNFCHHFLAVVEQDVPGTKLKGWTLLSAAGDMSIIESLGGEQRASMSSLAHVYQLMEMGENGPSHVDWQSNFAYVRSPIDKKLWAVHWSMNYQNEWTIGAVVVPHRYVGWPSGSRLFT